MGAYWVFTYAMPRLLAGVWRSRWLDGLAAFTYFVEGICYHVEQKKYKSTNEKATFVAYASYFLAVFVTVRCVYQWNPMENGWTFSSTMYSSWLCFVSAAIS